MKMLHRIFNLLEPEKGTTRLSRAFNKWQTARIQKWNADFVKSETEGVYLNAPGAGNIYISDSSHQICGGACGFHFSVEWGRFGYAGGVLGRDNAKKLAEHILRQCEDTGSEQEEYQMLLNSEETLLRIIKPE